MRFPLGVPASLQLTEAICLDQKGGFQSTIVALQPRTGLYNVCKSVREGNHSCEMKGFIVDECKTLHLCAEG
jgi:hypothetical protein